WSRDRATTSCAAPGTPTRSGSSPRCRCPIRTSSAVAARPDAPPELRVATGRAAWLRRSLERRSLLFALALAVGTSAGLVAAAVGIVDAALVPVSGADAADGRLLAPLVWAVAGVPIAAVGLLGAAAVRELTRLLGVLRAGET